ncbi:amidohydrolase family protein [Nevskia sp.]|uniref:amidohydrolase family protein n=1 Tax=Nevskia sp. TaxID=1929292 RepID=UPI0025EFD38F|nr:amidohydrolase family protein [Nevskia sp.]
MIRRHLLTGVVIALLATRAEAELFAIRNAVVHTGGRAGTLTGATVVVRNGRIEAVGTDVLIPEGVTPIEAQGRPLTPGIIVAHSHLGLKEIDGVEETNDVASEQKRYSAGLDVADALNPRSALLPVNRIDGVTRAMTAPDSKKGGSLIAGQGAIISLAGSLAEGGNWIVKPHAAMFAALGEQGREIAGSRPAAFAALREALEEARSGGLRLGDGLNGDAQLSPLDVEALKRVLNREMPLVLQVERASDILAALKLADDYGLQLIVSGGAEAHRVAAELASRSVPVLIDPSRNLPAHFETLHVRPDAPAVLAKAGVKFAFIDSDDKGSHNARNLRQLAGIAVANGMRHDDALAAITLKPAEILGLSNVLGSIEPGKIADLVLWDRDPLEVTSAPDRVWIEGRAMPMVSRQTLLRDRYLKRLKAPPAK